MARRKCFSPHLLKVEESGGLSEWVHTARREVQVSPPVETVVEEESY